MKKFCEIVKNPYDGLQGREIVEWSNLWWDKANLDVSKRYLLIGDSTVRMVRGKFAEITGSPVDMIGTSSRINDVLFVNLVDCFFSSNHYQYDAVFIQLGHHSQKSINGVDFSDEDLQKYEDNMKSLIEFLFQYTRKIILESIFDQVVVTNRIQKIFIKLGLKSEEKDMKVNAITRKKSVVLKKLSNVIPFCEWLDINKLIDNTSYIHIDHIHFENAAKKYIASEMAKML